jgi:hypothetical protein
LVFISVSRAFESIGARALRCVSCAALGTVFAATAGAQVRISQIYGGGGDLGAVFASDFIELYNAGSASVALGGWSVQYTSAIGGTWQVTALPALSLGPGRYLLIKEADGSTLTGGQSLALPTPDSSDAINLSATAGKVALCNSTTALSGATPTSASIVDFVGYGANASWREPFSGGASANNAPTANVDAALYRVACGATDSDANNADFALVFPAPRNTSVAASNGVSAIGLAQPYFAEPLQSVRLTVAPFVCASLALDSGTTVTIDLSAIGGAGAAAMVDDGTSGDEIAGDGIFSLAATIAGSTPAGARYCPITVLDGGASGGGLVGVQVLDTSRPDNDDASRATAVALGSSTLGDFTGASAEYNPVFDFNASPGPQSLMGARRGLWYSVVGNGNTLVAETCASGASIDTVLGVFDGTSDGLTSIAFNDDNATACGSGSYLSSVSWCSQSGATYYIWVAPWTTGAQTFGFTLAVSDSGVSCSGAASTAASALAGVPSESEPPFGPAANDGCDSSPGLFTSIASPTSSPQTLQGSTRAYGFMRDVDWYRFQASTSGFLSASLTANFCGIVELRQLSATGTCATNVLLSQSPLSQRCMPTSFSGSPIIAGNWYALRVIPLQNVVVDASTNAFGGVSVGARANFYVLDTNLGGPPNDSCAQALDLSLGAAPVAGSTLGATHDTSSSCDAGGNDVWFRITTSAPGTLHIDTCGSALDTVVTAYDACGGSALGCNDDAAGAPCAGTASSLALPGVPAGTYFVRVSDKGVPGNFVIEAALTIDNDTCATATAVAVPSSTLGSTSSATLDVGLPLCDGPGVTDVGGNTSITAAGVWYAVSSATGGTLYADTLTASFDTKISIYTGTCGALSCVTMNDDIVPSYHSKVAWVAAPGQTYFVFVHGFGNSTGDFTLDITRDPTPSNDDCATPTVVSGAAGSQPGTNVGATGDPSKITSSSLATCATSFSYWDTWFSWTAPCTSSVTFATCGSFDTVLSVHSTCPTSLVGAQLTAGCNQDAEIGCAPGSRVTLDVTGGTTYLIRVATAGALAAEAGGGSNYTLTWSLMDTDLDGTADCFDGCPSDPAKIAPGLCGCGVADVDSDGDGTANCLDGCPNDPAKIAAGQCGCGALDTDSDGDGVANCLDGCPNDPGKIAAGQCGCGIADTDSDGDGTANCLDGCPNDPAKIAAGICGCGTADVDSDGDGALDCNDACPLDPNKTALGVCGCGVADSDDDGDGVANCIDGCPLDASKIAPGACGCGTADVDSDGDGVADCIDNCDNIANPAQQDCDLDGVGDACELASGSAVDTDTNGIPDNCEFGAVVNYCTSGNSTHNCLATMSAVGTPSVSASSGFTLIASDVERNKSGLIFYGVTGTHSAPWYGASTSYLCVKSPTQRTPAADSGGPNGVCSGSLSVDFLDYIATHPGALGSPLSAGEVVWAQAWYRDPPAPKTTNLSNGLQFTLAP